MLLTILGSIGIGLVWGWLLGHTLFFSKFRYQRLAGLVVGTAAAAVPSFLFAGIRGVVGFVAAAALTIWIRTSWFRELQRKAKILNP